MERNVNVSVFFRANIHRLGFSRIRMLTCLISLPLDSVLRECNIFLFARECTGSARGRVFDNSGECGHYLLYRSIT